MQAGKGMSPFVAPQKHVKKVPISTAPAASSNFGKSMKYKWANVVYKKGLFDGHCNHSGDNLKRFFFFASHCLAIVIILSVTVVLIGRMLRNCYYLLPATYCLLPTACYLLPATYCLLPAACYLLPAIDKY